MTRHPAGLITAEVVNRVTDAVLRGATNAEAADLCGVSEYVAGLISHETVRDPTYTARPAPIIRERTGRRAALVDDPGLQAKVAGMRGEGMRWTAIAARLRLSKSECERIFRAANA